MKTKADLKKIARQIWHHHQGNVPKKPSIMHPKREWFIGLLVAAVSVVLVGSWSGRTYVENRALVTDGVAVDTPDQVFYTAEAVEEALEIIAARSAVVSDFITTNELPVPDPTIDTSIATDTATSSDVVDAPIEQTEPSIETGESDEVAEPVIIEN
jgi:hypothetical protein